jgi:hypothetical protein
MADSKHPGDAAQAAVRGFDRTFRAALPQAARGGSYSAVKGDAYDGKLYADADGLFRVTGSDWIFRFTRGRFVEAFLARPPKFGGDKVIEIGG